MVVGVEVVVGALADPAQRGELGQDGGGRLESVEQPEPGERIRPGEQRRQLGELALARRLGGAAASRRASATVSGSGSRPSPGRESARPAGPAAGRRRTSAPSRPAGRPPRGRPGRRSGRSASRPPSGTAIALTVKSRSRRSSSIDPARSAATSTFQPPVAGDHPPGRELVGELERMPPPSAAIWRAAAATSPSKAMSTSTTSPPEDRVADGAADEPGAVGDVAQARAGHLDRRRLAEALLEPGQMGRAGHRSAPIGAGHARGDPAGDLVVDRAEAVGELLGADLLLVLAADQDGGLAGLDLGRRGRGRR